MDTQSSLQMAIEVPAADVWVVVGLAALFTPLIFLVWRMLRRRGFRKCAMVYAIVMCLCMIWLVGGTILTYWCVSPPDVNAP